MKNVFKRELSSAFHHLYGYITVGLLLLISSILFFAYNLSYTNESISAVCAGMVIVSAVIIPVISVNAFPSRKKENTDSMYDMMPISTRDVVLGKYFAALALVLMPDVIIACYSVFAGFFDTVDHMASYSSLVGLVLFEAAWLAVCFFVAKSAKSRVFAYMLCYLLCIIWYFLAIVSILIPTTRLASLIGFSVTIVLFCVLLWVATKKILLALVSAAPLAVCLAVAYIKIPNYFAGAFENFINKFSIFDHFNSFTYGLFDLEGILYFLILTSLFVFLTWRAYEKKYEKPNATFSLSLKKATSVGLAALIVCSSLAISCAAAVVPDRFMSFDATTANKNSVSNEAKDFLSGLDKQVTLYLLEPTGMENYELYLKRIVATSDNLTLKKVFYADDPMFYIDRDISTDAISANSIIVECGDKYNYLSYYNLFVYSNEKLGATNMSYSEYSYYHTLFASNENYYEYYYSLIYDTTVYFNADAVLCQYIEYTSADIIPTSYYLTGHGEPSVSGVSNPYSQLGLEEINISENEIPKNAASILINIPQTDISDDERQKLLTYLENGGQLTFITKESNLYHENLCAVLCEYGMSAKAGTVAEIVTPEDGENTDEKEYVTEFSPSLKTDNDVLYRFQGTPTVIDANAIEIDVSAKEHLTVIPLLISSSESVIENSDTKASYTLACAVETPSGAKVAWFTGGDAFNKASTDSATAVMYTLVDWVTLEYKSEIGDIPACVYSTPVTQINSIGAKLFAAVIIISAVAIMVSGIVVYYIRKQIK